MGYQNYATLKILADKVLVPAPKLILTVLVELGIKFESGF